jgi:DNA (cytosine-5)-methyltransferase 1
MLKFIDLFCGIGGFRVALERLGHRCIFSSDIDRYAQEAYYANFGDRPAGDICEISEKDIPEHDILCAGFPCQSFSVSGKQSGIEDPRGKLFFEILRIANYGNPKFLLLENVKNILSIDNGQIIKIIESKLNEIGYILQKCVLNASHFGIPQSRERVYFVSIRKDLADRFKFTIPQENKKPVFLEAVLEENPDQSLFIQREDIFIDKDNKIVKNSLKPIRVGFVNKGGQGERIYSDKGHAVTLSAYGGGVGARTGLYQTPQGIRKLSVNECKTLMGFPKKHTVSSGMRGYQQLGNAVIPDMINFVWNGVVDMQV